MKTEVEAWEGISEPEIRMIYKHIEEYARAHGLDLRKVDKEPEDFKQEVMMNILTRKGYKNGQYDPSKHHGPFRAFIYRLCFNHLIDLRRKKFDAKSRKGVRILSMDAPLNEEGFTLAEVLPGVPDSTALLFELMDTIPNSQISPNYNLTWRSLFRLTFNSTPEEIAAGIRISVSRVKQLQRQLFQTWVEPNIA